MVELNDREGAVRGTTKHRATPRLSAADEERLRYAMRAGLRAERDSLIGGRAQVMRKLAGLPRDGSADEDRSWLLLILDAINRQLPEAIALAGGDDEASDASGAAHHVAHKP